MSALLNSLAGTTKFLAIDVNGKMIFVDDPSELKPGEIIISSGGRPVSADLSDLAGIPQGDESLSQVAFSDDITQLINQLELGIDPTALDGDFAPAAGGQQGSAIGESGVIERTGASSLASTAFETTGIGASALSTTDELDLARPQAPELIVPGDIPEEFDNPPVAEDEVRYLEIGDGYTYLLRKNGIITKFADEEEFGTVFNTKDSLNVDTLAMTNDGTLYATYKEDGELKLGVIDLTTAPPMVIPFALIAELGISDSVKTLFSGDEDMLYAATADGIYEIDLSNVTYQGGEEVVTAEFHMDIPELASGESFIDFAYSAGELYGISAKNFYLINENGTVELIDIGDLPLPQGLKYASLANALDGNVIISFPKESYVLQYDPSAEEGEPSITVVNIYDDNSNSLLTDSAGNSREITGTLSDNVSDFEDGTDLTFVSMTGVGGVDSEGNILGQYGYLMFNEDTGDYRYVLTEADSLTDVTSEVFTYTVEDDAGQTASAELEIKLVPGDIIEGTSDPDVLTGTEKGDVIFGDEGNDEIYGGAGGDELHGGQGSDILVGGSGADNFIWTSEDLGGFTDVITDFSMVEGDKIDISDLLDGMSDTEIEDYINDRVEDISGTGDAQFVIGDGVDSVTIVFEDTSAADLADYLIQQNEVNSNG